MTAVTCEPIEECAGFKKLLAAVEHDEATDHDFKTRGRYFHDYRGKLLWTVERAKHYAEKLSLDPAALLDQWESKRSYWYMNYYQDANQPRIDAANVRVFETVEDCTLALGRQGFRCPACGGVSKSPHACNSGLMRQTLKGKQEVCDWKVYGLFADLGKGVYVFVKQELRGELIFMPIAWETPSTTAT
jgi:hypothetical protein